MADWESCTQAVMEICGKLPEIIDVDSVPGTLIAMLVALQSRNQIFLKHTQMPVPVLQQPHAVQA